jgi:hypothetical protein
LSHAQTGMIEGLFFGIAGKVSLLVCRCFSMSCGGVFCIHSAGAPAETRVRSRPEPPTCAARVRAQTTAVLLAEELSDRNELADVVTDYFGRC